MFIFFEFFFNFHFNHVKEMRIVTASCCIKFCCCYELIPFFLMSISQVLSVWMIDCVRMCCAVMFHGSKVNV